MTAETKKKKSKASARKKSVQPAEKSPFWDLAFAILLMLFGLFMLLGSFGTGGPLPVGLFDATYWALGYGAYLTPLALIYYGILWLLMPYVIPLIMSFLIEKWLLMLILLKTKVDFLRGVF
jgi:hypothetical protein